MSIELAMPSTIFSSVIPFSSCLQSFPASGSFLMILFFTSSGQSIGASASASVLLMNIQDWFLLGLTGLISSQYKVLPRVLSNTLENANQETFTNPGSGLKESSYSLKTTSYWGTGPWVAKGTKTSCWPGRIWLSLSTNVLPLWQPLTDFTSLSPGFQGSFLRPLSSCHYMLKLGEVKVFWLFVWTINNALLYVVKSFLKRILQGKSEPPPPLSSRLAVRASPPDKLVCSFNIKTSFCAFCTTFPESFHVRTYVNIPIP